MNQKNYAQKKIGLFIPTLNACSFDFNKVLDSALNNENSHLNFYKKLIVDTQSQDNTVQIAKNKGFCVCEISKNEFTHGLVRAKAIEKLRDCDFVFFINQDVLVSDGAFEEMLNFMEQNNLAAVYGRQVPNLDYTNIFEEKSRKFNYPNKSCIKDLSVVKTLGIKTVFSSDAFILYNVKNVINAGNFPKTIKFGEDMYMAAMLIKEGKKVGYCANAVAMHSNKASIRQEFERFFYAGEFHKQFPWIQKEFGSMQSQGIKMVFSVCAELVKQGKFYLIPKAVCLNLSKWLGFKAGYLLK